MSDGAGAPAAPAAAPSAAPAAANTNTEAKTAAPKAAPAPTSWSDDEKKQFFELAKKSPFKAKIKGEERGIDSEESLRDLLNHAQRGVGASKVVEEAKRERAEAEKMRSEAAKERELLKRAKAGDWEARKELGLLDPREVEQRNREWEAVPPEVRELHEGYQREQKRADELEAKWKAKEAEEHQRREQAEIAKAKSTVMNETKSLLDSLGIGPENGERLMPHLVGAVADLHELGLELGVDMTPDLIAQRFKERVGAFNDEMFSSMKPERAIAAVSSQLDAMDDATLLKALPPKLASRISKLVARSVTAKRQQAGGLTTQQPANDEREESREAPKVLSFGRRW